MKSQFINKLSRCFNRWLPGNLPITASNLRFPTNQTKYGEASENCPHQRLAPVEQHHFWQKNLFLLMFIILYVQVMCASSFRLQAGSQGATRTQVSMKLEAPYPFLVLTLPHLTVDEKSWCFFPYHP